MSLGSAVGSADVVIRNARLIDPAQGLDFVGDLAIRGGRVHSLGPHLNVAAPSEVDAELRILCPGFVDLHTHLYVGVSELGLAADEHCLPNGVTTAVDAGTAGALTFDAFRRLVVTGSLTRVKAFLNLSSIGLVVDDARELGEMRYVDPRQCARVIGENSDVLVGVKVRIGAAHVGNLGLRPLLAARGVAEEAGVRIMVHLTTTELPLVDVLEVLRPGDIVTHAFHGRGVAITQNGHIKREVWKARERGVRFDVGHGSGGFSFETARIALADGFMPDSISTDLHTFSLSGPVLDLAKTATKFFALGMSLEAVLAALTCEPARMIGLQHEAGSLKVGGEADLALLELTGSPIDLMDSMGSHLLSSQELRVWRTYRAGKAVAPRVGEQLDPRDRVGARPWRCADAAK